MQAVKRSANVALRLRFAAKVLGSPWQCDRSCPRMIRRARDCENVILTRYHTLSYQKTTRFRLDDEHYSMRDSTAAIRYVLIFPRNHLTGVQSSVSNME